MLSLAKLLCGDEDRLSDGLALFSVVICYPASIGNILAVIGFLVSCPLEILDLRKTAHSFKKSKTSII